MDVDPYGRENPLGPGNMLRSYKAGAHAVAAGLTYAALVRGQEELDMTGVDAGLAVTVSAYQRQLKQQAAEFGDTGAGDFIRLATGVGNFVSLFAAFVGDPATMRQLSDGRSAPDVLEQLASIGDHAGEIAADGDTAIDHIEILQTDVGRTSRRLDSAFNRALAVVDEDGKAASAKIDELTKMISENIQAIVDGATETGDAVTELGIGVLGVITGGTDDAPKPPASDDETDGDEDDSTDTSPASPSIASDESAAEDVDEDSDGDDDDEDEDDDEDHEDDDSVEDDVSVTNKSDGKVPDVSFVVSAIKAGSKGAEKYAAAIAHLQLNNDRLAAQYQRLATANRLVAVAKVTQAQKALFAASVNEAALSDKAIRASWSTLRTGLVDWSKRTGDADAAALARLLPGALKQWQAVAADLHKIKRALTGSGGLPTR